MRTAILTFVLLAGVLFSGAFLPVATAQESAYTGPVFDTHLHYSSTAWAVISPDGVLKKLDRAGVTLALVSSTPDKGTASLLAIAPERLVAGLRPYRTPAEKVTWYKNPDLIPYSKTRLALLGHQAFGEVILNYPQDLETPQMSEYLGIVAKQKLVLHVHASAAVVAAVFKKQPGLKVLWAHAGLSEPASVIVQMMGQYSNLWAELSYRAEDILGGDGLEPAWKALLLDYQRRLTIGSDTWENGRWRTYQYLIDQHRQWLGKLPKDVARKIAYQNARTLFEK